MPDLSKKREFKIFNKICQTFLKRNWNIQGAILTTDMLHAAELSKIEKGKNDLQMRTMLQVQQT